MSWEYVTLDKLGTISRGRSKHRPRNDKTLFGGKYPFVQTADVKAAELYLTEYTDTYNERGLEQSKLWKAGTLCITIAANIADTAILGMDACFPDSVMGFIPYDGVSNVKFVKYAFPAPPIEVQDRIVAILSAYDDLIENNKKQIKLLEEAAQRLYKEWFVDLRFPGYEDTSIVDGVPEGWKKLSMNDIADYLNGYAFKPSDWRDKGKPIIKIKEMNEGITSSTPRNDGSTIPDKYIIKAGDILFSWSATLTAMIWDSEDGLLNQHLFKVTPSNGVCREYVLQSILKTLDEFKNLTTGSTMKHIQRGKLKEVFLNLPSSVVMDKFAFIAETYREKILSLQKQNNVLKEARDRLLPKLINREIEV